MKEMKRILSLVLCFVMLVGMLPAFAIAVKAEEVPVDALVVMSDLHVGTAGTSASNKKALLQSVLTTIQAEGIPVSSVNSAGDMYSSNDGTVEGNAAQITDWVDDVFDARVNYVWTDHDRNAADISKSSGLVYTGNYYVYLLSMADLSTNDRYNAGFYSNAEVTAHIEAFKTTVAGLDKTKPLFIVGHQPLFDNRNDNYHAYEWALAINEVAANMDVAYFFGHNHDYDQPAEYYYGKGTTIQVPDLQSNNHAVELNFTHVCAGYMDPGTKDNNTRLGTALAVVIYEDSIQFTAYDKDGIYDTDNRLDVNETVARSYSHPINSVYVEVPGDPGADDVTVSGDSWTEIVAPQEGTAGSAETYKYVLDTNGVNANTKYLIVNTGSDGTAYALTNNNGTAARTEVRISNGEIIVENDTNIGWTFSGSTSGNVSNQGRYIYPNNGSLDLNTSGTTLTIASQNNGAYRVYRSERSIILTYHYYLTYSNNQWTGGRNREVNSISSVYLFAYDSTIPGTEAGEGTPGTYYRIVGELSYEVDYGTGAEEALAVIREDLRLFQAQAMDAEEAGAGAEVEGAELTLTWIDTYDPNVPGDYAVQVSYEGHNLGTVEVVVPAVSTFYTAEGNARYTMAEGATAEQALAAVQAGVSVYAAADAEGTNKQPVDDSQVTWTWVDAYDGGKAGPYTLTVSMDGKTLASVEVKVNVAAQPEQPTDPSDPTGPSDPDEPDVDEPTDGSVTVGGTTTTKKTVYVLTTQPTAGNSYLIVNGNAAGNYFALANNNGNVAATGVTVKTGNIDSDSQTETYIELNDATKELWAVTSGLKFENNDSYLGYTTSGTNWNTTYTFALSGTASNWSYSSNRLSTSVGSGYNSTTYYLRYNSGWTWTNSSSASGRSVYFYIPTEIEQTVDSQIVYTMQAEDLNVVLEGETTRKLNYALLANGEAATLPAGGSYSFQKFDDEAGIIASIDADGTVHFTGELGSCDVKVAYTWTDPVKGQVTAYKYVKVTTSAPHYTLELHQASNGVPGDEITAPIAIKGVEAGDTYSVWAVIKYHDGILDENGEDGVDMGALENPEDIEWVSSDPTIATVDAHTGVITFTGKDGSVEITATYKHGNKPSDTITISATKTQYVIPEDGTNDFPDYPNEGAIRFDKTATAVGNFSETGIAQLELTMTGVPYTTGNRMDVVLMLDRSSSMYKSGVQHRISSTVEATKVFIKNIVMNEDGTFNDNRILVLDFLGGNLDSSAGGGSSHKFQSNRYTTQESGGYQIINDQAELDALLTKIETDFKGQTSLYGTEYAQGLELCYNALKNSKADGNQQFCVFMSDGIPNYMMGEKTHFKKTSDITARFTGTSNSTTPNMSRGSNYEYEYYSTQMKNEGVTVFSVGLGLKNTNSAWSGATKEACEQVANMLLNDIAGPAGETAAQRDTGNTVSKMGNYFFSVADANAAADMKDVFATIARKILQAATNVTVEDQITDQYTMIFDIPTNTAYGNDHTISGITNDFYIEFAKYAQNPVYEQVNITSFTHGTKYYTKSGTTYTQATSYVAGTTYYVVSDYTRGASTFSSKLYLQKNGNELSAKNVTAPVFEQKVIGDKGSKMYWTTDASYASKAAVTYTSGETTYYFIPYGMSLNEDKSIPAGWYNMTSGAYAKGKVDSVTNMSTDLVIATPYFVYNAETKMIYWTVDKLDTEECVLRYFLYLDHSATDVGETSETNPGAYPTNDHAYITYTNYLGNDCQEEFPIPQLTWSGAQVSYVFYLVNAQGQPINRSGQVVDFANAVFVTDIYTEHTVWNKGEDGQITADSELSIEWLARNLLPEDYKVYDEGALYQLHVYGSHTGDSIFDYFTIGGNEAATISNSLNSRLEGISTTAGTVSLNTTKVYNTKAGEKISGYGTYTSEATDSINNETVLTGFDFYATTVAFAVVWQPALAPDTVVVDYGLDVLINVVQNDLMQENVISGIGLNRNVFGSIKENVGVSPESLLGADPLTSGDGYTISIEPNKQQVRFSQNDMTFESSVTFYYESEVKYYVASEQQTGYLHSSVTVIPATTIYYEDSFVEFSSFAQDDTGWTQDEGEYGRWFVDGNQLNGVQAQDRPGVTVITGVLDADNNYGYDAAYSGMSTYSMGSARKITVAPGIEGWADFEFYGTGFDVISTTTNTSGTIIVEVYTVDAYGNCDFNNPVESFTVDTYYGFQYADGVWTPVDSNNPAALYQVPVMKIDGLPYADENGKPIKYHASVLAFYGDLFDHTGDGQYEFALDAIRIYDPTGNQDSTANDAYIKDGEGWPTYEEVRNYILDAKTFESVGTEDVNGIVFIDSNGENASISNYESFGPNNELYLAPGQAITFNLNAGANVAKIQMALKTVTGTGNVEVYTVVNGAKGEVILDQAVDTATDMYYTLWQTEKVKNQNGTEVNTQASEMTLVIKNSGTAGSGILSITNVKVTHTEAPAAPRMMMFSVRRSTVDEALATMNVVEEPVEPDTQPSEPETEPSEPETEPSEPETEPTVPETEPAKPDFSDLKQAVEQVKKLKEKDYTKESFKAVKDAQKAAEKVLKDKKATQEQIDAALAKLTEAVNALEMEPDFTALEKALAEVKKLKEKDYTKESFKAVKDAQKAAEKVLKDKKATQEDIDEALAELNEALSNLEAKSDKKPGKANPQEAAETIIADIIGLISAWLGNRN